MLSFISTRILTRGLGAAAWPARGLGTRGLGTAAQPTRVWNVYLAGEIHSAWRTDLAAGVRARELPIELTSPNPSHADSDDCGAIILGMEESRPNWDAHSARMNLIRTKTLINSADIVVVRFGDKYRQWNAAFEAGYASALGKPVVIQHPPELGHMLKEVNAGALAVCEDLDQVLSVLDYTITGRLPPPRDGPAFVPIADRLGKGNPSP
ncbi:hypothetical protein T492DRAFT_1063410 [Pavlovales sp. CCMP2436]|nr:hypothetical protein T492DRAFT_1063410 [Pavlovales sp. CCMP2436]|mmetsp:Transcript_23772/g.60204  ORF Transcript_23772/g.60204 Transcript_23772/m.60204 type:complete len:209 (-) Transcript_23772:176-802(-)